MRIDKRLNIVVPIYGDAVPRLDAGKAVLVDGAPIMDTPVIAWVQDFYGLQPGSTYRVWGFQFNGLSQAAGFGDEFGTATNYPLVRITNQATHHVFYAKTHDHSTMAVATATLSTLE